MCSATAKSLTAVSVAAIMMCTFGAMQIVQAAQPVMSGTIAQDRVHQLTSQINWYHSLPKAEAEASKEGKLVFWMHMLGHIDGST